MLQNYFADISEELNKKSKKIREYFSTHNPSAGSNREGAVAKFLEEYLPKKYFVSTGLILSKDGEFSKQADIIIADQMSNAPLFGDDNEKIWLIESVYTLIEVKTQLTPTTIKDSIIKCRKFKSLQRDYADDFGKQKIRESLFVLWAFEGPDPIKIKENIEKELVSIPREEQPDFIIVPNSTLISSGHYYEISTLGQLNSQHRNQLLAKHGGDIDKALGKGFKVLDLGNNTLLAWLGWYTSWLYAAGERRAKLESYVPHDYVWGKEI